MVMAGLAAAVFKVDPIAIATSIAAAMGMAVGPMFQIPGRHRPISRQLAKYTRDPDDAPRALSRMRAFARKNYLKELSH